jgi:hypothetical protein
LRAKKASAYLSGDASQSCPSEKGLGIEPLLRALATLATVREDDIGVNALFQHLEPRFDLLTLFREKSISEGPSTMALAA